ncbi:MAG: YidC/Oxa1 family membrane protein insertase [Bacteroidales bacterium]
MTRLLFLTVVFLFLSNLLSAGPVSENPVMFSGMWEWMRWLCFGLLYLLSFIHKLVPDWGTSIIVLALIVRIALYPLSRKAMISQKRFVDAQKLMSPELKEIKNTYKGGEQSERILQLYKKYKVSPIAGLKPLGIVLLQLPILIALFQVLGEAPELQGAGFLWIESLAAPDKLFSFGFNIPLLGSYFNVLPVLMSVFTLLSFKLAPTPTAEKKEQRVQLLFLIGMTLMFFFLFYSFPAGMVLYWTFANIFHIVQYRIMVRVKKDKQN